MENLELYLFSQQPIEKRQTVISRTVFFEGELFFIIKSGESPISSSISTVRRTFSDFIFLQKWLAYENPYSWLPILRTPRNPFSLPLKLSREVIREVRVRLNSFLRILLTHPTFSSHELLWEFLLIQDFSKSQSIDRCRRKLESSRELQYDNIIVYDHTDLNIIKVFFQHAITEVEAIHTVLSHLTRVLLFVRAKMQDYSDSYDIFDRKLYEVNFLSKDYSVINPDFKYAFSNMQQHFINFSYNILNVTNTSNSVISTLSQPLALISQLEQQLNVSVKNHNSLEKLNGKSGWMLGMFEEKRFRDIRQTEDKIYLTQNEIRRLSSDIKHAHIVSAYELGGFYTVQEAELRRIIKDFSSSMIRDHRERFNRLKRVTDRYKSMRVD